MNTFKKKSLYAALAGVSALGVTGAAQAVSVNPDGLGQVLIYPYYTVRDKVAGSPYTSLLSVVNSTNSAKAVKVRFLEGRNSREVLDFNLYLSRRDVWVAAIIPTATGAGIYTPDTSCTDPKVSASATNPTPFLNYAYTGNNADGGGTSLDRTREGYVEIIEMGSILGGSDTEDAVTHISGVPPCFGTTTNTIPSTVSTDTVFNPLTAGGLFGNMTLINVLSGEDFGTEAVALEGFSQTALWTPPDSLTPNLASVNPAVSVVTTGTNTFVTSWAGSLDAVNPVSAVLMHNNVYNEFVLETATKSGTDWVITMPTKRFYISNGPGNNAGRLFQRNFNGNSGSCDDVGVTTFDREERTVSTPGQFSPPPPTAVDSLCWEVNVMSFNNTRVLGSTNGIADGVPGVTTSFASGWVALDFRSPQSIVSNPTRHQLVAPAGSTVFNTATGVVSPPGAATTFNGLPVIGFAATTFSNGTLTGAGGASVLSNYGGAFYHRATRSIQ